MNVAQILKVLHWRFNQYWRQSRNEQRAFGRMLECFRL